MWQKCWVHHSGKEHLCPEKSFKAKKYFSCSWHLHIDRTTMYIYIWSLQSAKSFKAKKYFSCSWHLHIDRTTMYIYGVCKVQILWKHFLCFYANLSLHMVSPLSCFCCLWVREAHVILMDPVEHPHSPMTVAHVTFSMLELREEKATLRFFIESGRGTTSLSNISCF